MWRTRTFIDNKALYKACYVLADTYIHRLPQCCMRCPVATDFTTAQTRMCCIDSCTAYCIACVMSGLTSACL